MERGASKVPEVMLAFWIVKIAATTLGETGGDAVTMSMHLGYLIGTAIFASILVVAVGAQVAARRFHPYLYWAVVVATTTAGTTLADLLDRSLGIGYVLTRPMGATVGDLLDKPLASGGLALSRYSASAVLACFMVACLVFFPQKAARHRARV